MKLEVSEAAHSSSGFIPKSLDKQQPENNSSKQQKP